METNQGNKLHGQRKRLLWAVLFIVAGSLLLANNMGYINDSLIDILISWPMLLIVLGFSSLFGRSGYVGGSVLILIGTYFLLPKLGWIDYEPIRVYWPIVFIVVGIILLLRPKIRHNKDWKNDFRRIEENRSSDGFVVSDNVAGGVRQVILEKTFKGARIRNTFGGTIIDLRRTELEQEVAYIYIYCTFGGVELFVPPEWNILNEANVLMGGLEDKRYGGAEKDLLHKVILRGNITFGGVELKS
ncbi:LiaI-LiaF-like domain-containing protein [Parabacteroides sp. Marseille-P3160]|uniref:LiaF transmembrane domain-containing protein n=1 Tax=Parabacteroides sp. Marseille-P3160 TaxID=1917887 RepID=UPI00135A267A|nr:DUF5668 domain-containing protein [Parabacteroides sp. Marseille-P3160]